MATSPLQLLLTVAILATARCQDAAADCRIVGEPTVDNIRNYIWCLRRQLYVIEGEIMAAGNQPPNNRHLNRDDLLSPPEVGTSDDESPTPEEYQLLETRKSTSTDDRPEVTPKGQFAVNYGDIEGFPDCHGLTGDQCASLLAFLEQTTMSLAIPNDDVTGSPGGGRVTRMRRSVNYNSISKLKMAHLKSKKLQQLDPVMMKNIKMLIRWRLQNGGNVLRNTPKFKGRWGRSVGHVTNADDDDDDDDDQSRAAETDQPAERQRQPSVRRRERRNVMKAWLAANVNSLSPKVKQMLADYLIWKAKNPGFIKLTSRHG
ncbi:hypothetical protein LSH36_919g01000 [Paralvinella palmiformis]|uniref:Uncharacterized protein n=1 Tax=Paralvinella palmiformis TaxID=53620 RepID=A0AAD9IXK2_9ANNE|nr:hypothetical protein LSH36_919g01000 [Paralvinella palmiformis]